MSDERAVRRLPFWLIISVLVNMLLVGALGGYLLRGGQTADPSGRLQPQLVADDAGLADRRAVRQALRNAYKASAEQREARDAARRRLAEALGAEPYETSAVQAAFADMRAADAAMNKAVHDALAEEMADLTPRQRDGVKRALERGPRRARRQGRFRDRQRRAREN